MRIAKTAMKFAPEIRLERVKEIERAILENRYRILREEIAEKIIRVFRRLPAKSIRIF
ncbi:MAG TPA: flagellar biosynthesis anti-sigma factor FlgM [Desulfobacterales bacterium]|nr:flagellar biosynthesis anti-sigma factor FlgM [Desulfobacterales bacterium]